MPESDVPASAATQGLASAGMERMIPIRFSELVDGAGLPPIVTDETLQLSIEKANQVYKTAGVQLYIESVDVVVVPTLADQIDSTDASGDLKKFAFSAVRSELAQLFPSMPLDAWSADTKKDVRTWLHAANAIYEDVRHAHVWIAHTAGSSGAMPDHGRGIRMSSWDMNANRAVFAHEFGHFLGLRHTFSGDDSPDPETLIPRKLSDRWDLVYKPGTSAANPHTFYTSRADAAADEASLQLIDTNGNCVDDDPANPPGTLTCSVGLPGGRIEKHTTGEAAMKGLAFQYADGSRGVNVMSYNGADDAFPYSISDSQVELVRNVLRWDLPFGSDDVTADLGGYNTAAYGTPRLGSRRPRLGNFGPSEPAQSADFDGDGRRDIVYWIPARSAGSSGRFVALLSSKGFSNTAGDRLDVAFGGLGDIPVLGDYNGDGRTDVAVFQPGGGINRDDPSDAQAYWRWCPTASAAETTDCTSSPAPIAFGLRGDTPIAGYNFDGVAGDDLAHYRPTNGEWAFRNLASSATTARAIGMVRGGVVPLPGKYDCDEKADMAVYEPATAKFKLLGSEQGLDTLVTTQFDPQFVPFPSGAGEDRSGVVVLAGMTTPVFCTGPSGLTLKVRRAAAVYYPHDRTWNVAWNPTNPSVPIVSCVYGTDTQQPISGIDSDGDGRSDFAFLRNDGTQGTVFMKPTFNDCSVSGTVQAYPWAGRPRVRMWAVPDMTGDGHPDLVGFDPEALEMRWFTSDSGFTTAHSRTLPDPNAILL